MAAKARKISTVEKKLVGVADVVIDAAQRRRDPTFAIPVRSLSNVTFDERKGLIELGKRKQAPLVLQRRNGQEVHADGPGGRTRSASSSARNLTTSLREIYYRTKHTIKELAREHARHPGRVRPAHRGPWR